MLNRTCIYDLLYHHWTVEIPFLTALLRLPALRAGPCTYRCWGGGVLLGCSSAQGAAGQRPSAQAECFFSA